MKQGKPIFLILLPLSVSLCGGCSLQEGLREGLSNGLSAALSAIIQAPVSYMLDQAYSQP